MPELRKTTFDQLTKKTWHLVEERTNSYLKRPLPVPLQEIAKALGINFIQFEPLLSTAGLVKIKNGYAIMVNTESPGANQNKGDVLNSEKTNWNELKPPLRFSIAHEIAHVLYFEAAEGKYRNDYFDRHARKLESECSKMSRAILIPKKRLFEEIGKHIFDVEHLKGLLSKFLVSAEVFVRRLQLIDIELFFKNTEGLIAYAQEHEGRIKFKACRVWGLRARSRFGTPPVLTSGSLPLFQDNSIGLKTDSRYPEGDSLEAVIAISGIESRLKQKGKLLEKINVPCAHERYMSCFFNCTQISKNPPSFLLTIEVVAL